MSSSKRLDVLVDMFYDYHKGNQFGFSNFGQVSQNIAAAPGGGCHWFPLRVMSSRYSLVSNKSSDFNMSTETSHATKTKRSKSLIYLILVQPWLHCYAVLG